MSQVSGIMSELDTMISGTSSSSSLGDLKTAIVPSDISKGYTQLRAEALLELGKKLQFLISNQNLAPLNPLDRLKMLAFVSDSFLKLVHAFKTDQTSWQDAQNLLVPHLVSLQTEGDIDPTLILLRDHISVYLVSLESWL